MTITEACRQLGISRVTMYNWEDAGKIHIRRYGRKIEVTEEEVARRKEERAREIQFSRQKEN